MSKIWTAKIRDIYFLKYEKNPKLCLGIKTKNRSFGDRFNGFTTLYL